MPVWFSCCMKTIFSAFHFGLLPLLFALAVSPALAELYRYQDSAGKWHFTDRPPPAMVEKVESLTIKNSAKKHPKPNVKRHKENGQYIWLVDNPLPVSIQIWLRWKGDNGFFHSQLIKSGQLAEEVWRQEDKGQGYDFYYLLGEPVARPTDIDIPPPYKAGKSYRISQGCNGRFSHSGRGSRYAVDIAMPVGSYIHAVKDGIVADARDDFTIGGTAGYFLDKANHVTIMHEDGSYAVYAHILHGSLQVKTGDKIKVGQAIARSGSTGYSTGPHLHFVIRYNSGQGSYSVPFRFLTEDGKAEKPREHKRYLGLKVED